jgi:hypothetical protein
MQNHSMSGTQSFSQVCDWRMRRKMINTEVGTRHNLYTQPTCHLIRDLALASRHFGYLGAGTPSPGGPLPSHAGYRRGNNFLISNMLLELGQYVGTIMGHEMPKKQSSSKYHGHKTRNKLHQILGKRKILYKYMGIGRRRMMRSKPGSREITECRRDLDVYIHTCPHTHTHIHIYI